MKRLLLFLLALLAIPENALAQSHTHTQSLNSYWKFKRQDVPQAIAPSFDDSEWEVVSLPHTFNDNDVLDDKPGYYKGPSWYRKEVFIPEAYRGQKVTLRFEGAGARCQLYVNSRYVGEHLGAFTAFNFDVEGVIEYGETNHIAVKVDNSENLSFTIPPVSADFSVFGGLYRDVFLTVKNKVFFNHNFFGSSGVFWQTPSVTTESAHVRIFGQVANQLPFDQAVTVKHVLRDAKHQVVTEFKQPLQIQTGMIGSFDLSATVAKPVLWSPENPYLYQLESVVLDAKGARLDVIHSAVGFRTIAISNRHEVIFNGSKTKLQGAARHQDYHRIGTALPEALHFKDMKMLKAMGANFTRLSHYPQAPAVYEACNKLGPLVYSEIPTVNWVPHGSPFLDYSMHMMQEMVYQNYNHPSAVIWGYHNEIWQAHTEALTHARSLENLTRKIDPYRLTAMAFHSVLTEDTFHGHHGPAMLKVAMINGFNVYEGWYRGETERLGSFFEKLRKLSPDRPILLSEYGAGSDMRIHSYQPTIFDFSNEYQIKYQMPYLKEGYKRDWMVGFAIWNFIDFQRDGRSDAMPNFNNKGMVTSDRERKDVYYYYQAQWSAKPMIHIAGSHWKKRVEFSSSPSVTREVSVYSNLPEVELVVNGETQGRRKTEAGIAVYQATFKPGRNDLRATAIGQREEVTDTMSVDFNLINPNIKTHGLPWEGLNLNVGQQRTYFMDDVTDEVWLPCPRYTPGGIGFMDGRVYHAEYKDNPAFQKVVQGVSTNFINTRLDPVYQTFMEDITAFKIDVGDGAYKLSLLFSEPFVQAKKGLSAAELAWGMRNHDKKVVERVFDILINGRTVANKVNLANYAINYPVEVDYHVVATGGKGITIQFKAHSGKTILNGLRIRAL